MRARQYFISAPHAGTYSAAAGAEHVRACVRTLSPAIKQTAIRVGTYVGRGRSEPQRPGARAFDPAAAAASARACRELLHVSRPGARQVKTPTATSGFFYTEYKLFGSVRAIQVVVVEHLLCSFMDR